MKDDLDDGAVVADDEAGADRSSGRVLAEAVQLGEACSFGLGERFRFVLECRRVTRRAANASGVRIAEQVLSVEPSLLLVRGGDEPVVARRGMENKLDRGAVREIVQPERLDDLSLSAIYPPSSWWVLLAEDRATKQGEKDAR